MKFKLPEKVTLLGIVWSVKMEDALFNPAGDPRSAQLERLSKEIFIAKNFEVAEEGHKVEIEKQKSSHVTSFFHEMWHLYVGTIQEWKLDNEKYPVMFSLLATKDQGKLELSTSTCRNSMRVALAGIDDYLKVTESQQKRIKFLIENTHFAFPGSDND